MTPEYLKAEKMITDAIANRTISLSGKEANQYERGEYKPFFSLVEREGELICIATINRRNSIATKPRTPNDKEIVRLSYLDVTEGLATTDLLGKGKSWPESVRAVMRHFEMQVTG